LYFEALQACLQKRKNKKAMAAGTADEVLFLFGHPLYKIIPPKAE
jgi:hypothetical protein